MGGLQDQLQATLGDAYRIERELGGGGMSRLFLATEASLERQVVIKVLPPEYTSEVSAARFTQEIKLAAHLRHPHILPVLTAGAKGDLLYYIMPYVPGESLRHRLVRERKLPVADAVRIMAEVADALAHAHAEGVIHRDIKPENILLEAGHATLTDFGVARALAVAGSGGRMTETGMALGTPGYMAPEQAAGERDVGATADVYALAVVGYEMLAGAPPYDGPTAQAIFAAHLTTTPKPLTDVRPETPPAVVSAITRALAKNPAARVKTAAEFREALAVSLVPASPWTKGVWTKLGVAAVLTALVAAGWTWLANSDSATIVDPNLVAILPFRVSGDSGHVGYLREGMVDLLAAKLTGEGGPRAASPQGVISRWRRTVSDERDDLGDDEAIRLAEELGAGQLLLGGIVESPGRLTITATLRQVPGGRTRAQATAAGVPDSLPSLVDQLTAQLLARDAGEQEHRLTALMTASLPALREYVQGRAIYRRGGWNGAGRRFERALDYDSTFALAALELARASREGWGSRPVEYSRGIAAAWLHRDRLSRRDHAVLMAVAGPNYPAPSTVREHLTAWTQVTGASDDADLWYEKGEQIFHYGLITGAAQPLVQASQAFQKSFELDPNFTSLVHLPEIAAMQGDTAGVRYWTHLYLATASQDTSVDTVFSEVRWRMATIVGDTIALKAWRGRVERLDAGVLNGVRINAAHLGIGMSDADMAEATLEKRGVLANPIFNLNAGRPKKALAIRQVQTSTARSTQLRRVIVDALFGDGDSAAAVEASRELSRMVEPALRSADGSVALRGHFDLCVATLWRVKHGDVSTASRAVSLLRSLRVPLDTAGVRSAAALCAASIDAIASHVAHRADAAAAVHVLDSLMREGVPQFDRFLQTDPRHGVVGNLIVSELRDARGEKAEALAAIRRRSGSTWYLSTYLRHEGRLAALTGDTAGAIKAYSHYLALRYNPEPSLKPEVDRIRAELAKLMAARN